jgi:hypothetical protein
MKKIILTLMILTSLSSQAARNELIENRKVELRHSKKESHQIFQAESVQLTGTYTQNGIPVDLTDTNTIVVWEINGWTDYTNTYAVSTGVVSSTSNTVVFNLTPAQANLVEGTYLGFVRQIPAGSTNSAYGLVLSYQTIAVEWSPDSRLYNRVAPLTYTMTGPAGPQGPAGSNGLDGAIGPKGDPGNISGATISGGSENTITTNAGVLQITIKTNAPESVSSVNLTNGTAEITVSKITVTEAAVLPAIITESLDVDSLTGAGVSALRERRLYPIPGAGMSTWSNLLAGSSTYWGIRHNAVNLNTYYAPSSMATGIVVSGTFGSVDSTNYFFRINVGCRSMNATNGMVYSSSLNETVYFNAADSNFVISASLSSHNTNRFMQVQVGCITNSTGHTFTTNSVWINEVKEQF